MEVHYDDDRMTFTPGDARDTRYLLRLFGMPVKEEVQRAVAEACSPESWPQTTITVKARAEATWSLHGWEYRFFVQFPQTPKEEAQS